MARLERLPRKRSGAITGRASANANAHADADQDPHADRDGDANRYPDADRYANADRPRGGGDAGDRRAAARAGRLPAAPQWMRRANPRLHAPYKGHLPIL